MFLFSGSQFFNSWAQFALVDWCDKSISKFKLQRLLFQARYVEQTADAIIVVQIIFQRCARWFVGA